MKFYNIYLIDNNYHFIKTLKFNSPISKKDLDKYFLEDENLFRICCYNKKRLMVYTLYKDKTFNLFLYNEEKKMVYKKWYNGETEYPEGKEKYDEYRNEKRKEKLKRILKR